LGMYPHAVLVRESLRRRSDWWKWVAMTTAAVKVLRRFPMVQVRLTSHNKTVSRRTPLVFLGNNRYELDLYRVGTRDRLDRCELSLYIANTQTRWGMLMLAFRTAVGRLQQARDFESYCLSECWIESRRHRLHVALDGEVVKLSPPLHYRIWPKALSVYVPPERNG
jgi:diacylglycerol kinase family enzyme